MKFVQFTGSNGGGSIKCFIPSSSGEVGVGGKMKQDMLVFKPEVIDTINRTTVESGFTRLTDEQYASLLQNSKLFTHSVEKGYLAVLDELPYSAQTPADIIAYANQKINNLQARIEELEALLVNGDAVKGGKALKEAQAEVAKLTEKLGSLTADYVVIDSTLTDARAVLAEIDPETVASATAIAEEKGKAKPTLPDF